MTRKIPLVGPAVKAPEALIVPPVADQDTVTGTLVLSERRPVAEKVKLAPGWREMVSGEMTIEVIGTGATGPVTVTFDRPFLPARLPLTS
jgi:hypothetical protein